MRSQPGESVIRTKLYHSKWRLCARISVSGEVCSYKWIYIRCVIYFMFLSCVGVQEISMQINSRHRQVGVLIVLWVLVIIYFIYLKDKKNN